MHVNDRVLKRVAVVSLGGTTYSMTVPSHDGTIFTY